MTATQQEKHPQEGHLPSGFRPQPGPREARSIWSGAQMLHDEGAVTEGDALETSNDAEVDVAATPQMRQQPQRHRQVAYAVPSRDGHRSQRRAIGIDAARGLALLGMFAVHTLPAFNEEAERPTAIWYLFSGHASAIFAVLAGFGLALLTKPRGGDVGAELISRLSLTVRAVLILALGLTLNIFEVPVANILTSYGLFFLVAIPFTLMRFGALMISSGVFFILGPFLVFFAHRDLGYSQIVNTSFTDLALDPTGAFMNLLLVGSYPTVTWMGFICLGMALGQLSINRERTQIKMLAYGAVIAALASAASRLLIYSTGVDQLLASSGGTTIEGVEDVMQYGPDPTLPTDTMWWLAVIGPHTNTPFSLLYSAGVALAVIGGLLLLSRVLGMWLWPLAAAGMMTLTLYSSHLIFLIFVDIGSPWLWYLVQISVAMLFATAWQHAVGAGPLENIISKVSKKISHGMVTPLLRSELSGREAAKPTLRRR